MVSPLERGCEQVERYESREKEERKKKRVMKEVIKK